MAENTKQLGYWGEEIAQTHLQGKGYKIIEHNYRNKWGEIDIVAQKNRVVVFIEVKTRDSANSNNFLPEQSVTSQKQAKLRMLCEIYLNEHKYAHDQEWQIDVISISLDKSAKKAKINHIQNAVYG